MCTTQYCDCYRSIEENITGNNDMDDYLNSFNTIEESIQTTQFVLKSLKGGNFQLIK